MLQGGGALTSSFGILSSAILTFSLIFTSAFALAFVVGGNLAPVTDGSAAEINIVNQATGYYANITSAGNIALNIQSTPDGAYKVGKDTLSIDTNAKNGYKLYVSTISTAPGNGLYRTVSGSPDTSSGNYLSPSAGDTSTPVLLQTNTWGYTTSRSTSSQAPATYTDTDAAPTQADGGQAIWKAVPVYGDEDIFYTNTNPLNTGSPAISTNSVDIYYAANASTALPSGTYTNTVLYTAIVDAVDDTGVTDASISPVYQIGTAAGTEVTIATGLYPGFNTSNLGTITVTIGGQACTNITPTITSIGSLNITCNTPAQSSYGKKDVIVTIAKYGKTYTLTDAYEYIDPTPQFFKITTMQEMTHDICSESTLPTPNSTNWSTIITKDGADGTTAWTPGAQGTPQTVLEDVRDRVNNEPGTGHKYTIRKLPDGKCWMTKNLRYAPTSATTLSNSTDAGQKSDIGSGVSFTIPALGTANSGNTDYNGDEVIEVGTTCNVNTPAGNCNYGAYYDATYYSWHTATAGTGTASMTSGFATSSICPRGWRLPTGGDGNGTTAATTAGDATGLAHGDFKQLDIAFGGTGANNQAGGRANWVNDTYGFNAALLGYFSGAVAYNSGGDGSWWSSSVSNGDRACRLVLNTSVVFPQDGNRKGDSFALRCVAR